MGIRVMMSEHRWLVGAVVLAAVVVAVMMALPDSQPVAGGLAGNRVWYTDDDGKSFFADAVQQEIPFQRNGKEVVECVVYRCGVNAPPFVNHLVRKNPKTGIRQVKRPGAQSWIDVNDRAAIDIMKPNPPGGSIMDLMSVDPNQ